MAVNLVSLVKPFGSGDFPMVEDVDFYGGYRSVAALANLTDSTITASHRKAGMAVFVRADGDIYTLGSDLTTWTKFESGGGTLTGVLVYNPSLPASIGNGFKTWSELYTAMSSMQGPFTVFIDTPPGPTPNMGTGQHDFYNASLVGIPGSTVWQVDDGAQPINIGNLTDVHVYKSVEPSGFVILKYTSDTQLVTLTNVTVTTNVTSSTNSVLQTGTLGINRVEFRGSTVLNTGLWSCFKVAGGTHIYLYDNATINASTLEDYSASDTIYIHIMSRFATFNTTQSFFTGTIVVYNEVPTVLNGSNQLLSNRLANQGTTNSGSTGAVNLSTLTNIGTGNYQIAIGGHANTMSANTGYSIIIGGTTNIVNVGSHNFIGSGSGNNVSGYYSTIVSGNNNTVTEVSLSTYYSGIFAGTLNSVTDCYHSSIFSGNTNTINTSNYSSVICGQNNSINKTTSSTESYGSFIGSGSGMQITGGYYCSIVGGQTNTILGSENNSYSAVSYSTIVAGNNNSIRCGEGFGKNASGIFCGSSNIILGSDDSPILGGTSNKINYSDGSSIVVGNGCIIGENPIINTANNISSAIVSGLSNKIETGNYNFIGTGSSNLVGGRGALNTESSAILCGQNNSVSKNTKYVAVASTGNIASLSGLLTIDGFTLKENDEVLVWQQTTPSQNGRYIVQTGAWSGPFFDTIGDLIYSINGSTYYQRYFVYVGSNVYGTTPSYSLNNFIFPTDAVIYASTNIASLSGLQVIDGIKLQPFTIVIAANQTTPGDRLPYSVRVGAWSPITPSIGDVYKVVSGTNKDTYWKYTAANTFRKDYRVIAASSSAVVCGQSQEINGGFTHLLAGSNNTIRGGNSNSIISGSYSSITDSSNAIAGGYSIVMQNSASSAAFGYQSITEKPHTLIHGKDGKASLEGQYVHSTSSFYNIGDSQYSRLVLQGSSVAGNEIYLNTPTYLVLDGYKYYNMNIVILVASQTTADRACFRVTLSCICDGTSIVIDNQNLLATEPSGAGWTIPATFATNANELQIKVTNAGPAQDRRAIATIDMTEIRLM